jgi:hypothetical protein
MGAQAVMVDKAATYSAVLRGFIFMAADFASREPSIARRPFRAVRTESRVDECVIVSN